MRNAIALLLMLVLPSAMAADWTVVQTADISSPTVGITQQDANSSRQAVNAAVLGSDDLLASVTQRTTFSGGNVTLMQNGSAASSNAQTINLASAPSIIELDQTVDNFGTASMTQEVTGSDNVQALNYAHADDNINDATQRASGETIEITKTATTPVGNIQAVNYLRANRYTGTIAQMVNLSGDLVPMDLSGSGSGIRINSIKGDTSGAVSVTQTVTARAVAVDGQDFPTIILNHIAQ